MERSPQKVTPKNSDGKVRWKGHLKRSQKKSDRKVTKNSDGKVRWKGSRNHKLYLEYVFKFT